VDVGNWLDHNKSNEGAPPRKKFRYWCVPKDIRHKRLKNRKH